MIRSGIFLTMPFGEVHQGAGEEIAGSRDSIEGRAQKVKGILSCFRGAGGVRAGADQGAPLVWAIRDLTPLIPLSVDREGGDGRVLD
jgi:hypothetical protein